MKKNTYFQKNKYKVSAYSPLCKYRESPFLSLEKRSDIGVASPFYKVKKKGVSSDLFYKVKKNGVFSKEKTTVKNTQDTVKNTLYDSRGKGEVHNQLLHFLRSSSHFGRKSRHLDFAFPWHASMCDKFSGVRNQIPQISGKETLQSLVEAFYCIALVLRKGGKVLVVNKNSEFSPLFRPKSLDAKSPLVVESPSSQNNSKYVDGIFCVFSLEKTTVKNKTLNLPVKSTESIKTMGSQCRPATAPFSWVGGCLTNWKEISKSVATLLYFSKRFGRFIKQNNIHFPRLKKMKNSFQGFIHIEREQLLLKERPGVLFLFNAHESQQILHEAIALQIPVVALTDSSTDLSQITYPIPINSDSVHLVHRCLSKLMQITNRQGRFSKGS